MRMLRWYEAKIELEFLAADDDAASRFLQHLFDTARVEAYEVMDCKRMFREDEDAS